MKRNDEAMYWMKNDDWYKVDPKNDTIELTDSAPPRAVESFKMYLLRNDHLVSDMIIRFDDKKGA